MPNLLLRMPNLLLMRRQRRRRVSGVPNLRIRRRPILLVRLKLQQVFKKMQKLPKKKRADSDPRTRRSRKPKKHNKNNN